MKRKFDPADLDKYWSCKKFPYRNPASGSCKCINEDCVMSGIKRENWEDWNAVQRKGISVSVKACRELGIVR